MKWCRLLTSKFQFEAVKNISKLQFDYCKNSRPSFPMHWSSILNTVLLCKDQIIHVPVLPGVTSLTMHKQHHNIWPMEDNHIKVNDKKIDWQQYSSRRRDNTLPFIEVYCTHDIIETTTWSLTCTTYLVQYHIIRSRQSVHFWTTNRLTSANPFLCFYWYCNQPKQTQWMSVLDF